MDVGLFRKEPLCRHGGLPPQGRVAAQGSAHVQNSPGPVAAWHRARSEPNRIGQRAHVEHAPQQRFRKGDPLRRIDLA